MIALPENVGPLLICRPSLMVTGFLGAEGTNRLLKLEARARIKERNSVKAKK